MMHIFKEENGWFKVLSESIKDRFYYCFPREVYCTCPSKERPCKHLKEIYQRQADKTL